MTLSSFVILSLGGLIIVHWWLIPRADQRVRIDRTAASLPVFVTLAGLYVLRTVLLLAVLASGLVYLALFGASLGGGVTATSLGAAIHRVQRVQQALSFFSPGLSAFLAGLAALALVMLSRRHARVRAVNAFNTVFDEEFTKIAQQLQQGTADELPSDDPMRQIEAVMAKLRSELERAHQAGEAPKTQELETHLTRLAQQRFALDVRRRMTLRFDVDQVLMPPPANWKERFQLMLVSRGLLTSMRGSARLVSYASLILLVPSLLSLQTVVATSYAESRVVALDRLRVESSVREAEAAWQRAQNEATATTVANGGDDAEALDILSSQFENALGNVRALSIGPRVGVSLRTRAVRQAILRARAEHAPSSVETAPSARAANETTALQRQVLDDFDRTVGQRGPRTEVGRRIRADLERVRVEQPAVWTRMRTAAHQAGHSFQEAASIDDYGRFLTDRLVGVALDGAPGEGPLAQAARHLDVAIGHDAVNRLYRIKSAEYMAHLARGGSVADASSVVASDSGHQFWTSVESERFTSHVRDQAVVPQALASRPPTLLPKEEPHVNTRVAESVVSDLNRERRVGTDALASFEDWFPSQSDRGLSTSRARVTAAIDEAARVRVPSAGVISEAAESAGQMAARFAAEGAQSFMRARSFAALRGFSRIGGVLIGMEPGAAPALDFRAMSWGITDAGVVLTLTRQDGRIFNLGPYRPSLVHHALAYAADGRPVTVTMVTAAPLAELKILLHPALLDSALGCRAIELDRFVDRFTDGNIARERAVQQVESQQALYRRAWAAQFMIGYAASGEPIQKALAAEVSEARALLSDSRQMAASQQALNDPAWLTSSAGSPVVAKPQFYDEKIVSAMKSCAARPSTVLEAFDKCVRRRFDSETARFETESTHWYASPPESIVWSGVRERTYQLDRDLRFLTHGASTDALDPLDFMLQVSFTTAPAFLGGNENAAAYNDENPWEFPQLKQTIGQAVVSNVARTTADRDIFETMRQFTLLQRLFRVALAEKMGVQFPIERLPDLAAATAPGAAISRTPRWNAHPGALEMMLARRLMAVRAALEEVQASTSQSRALVDRLRTRIDQCVGVLQGSLNSRSLPTDAVWDHSCKPWESSIAPVDNVSNELTRLDDLTRRFMTETTEARRLRRALGVQLDEVRSQRACPAL